MKKYLQFIGIVLTTVLFTAMLNYADTKGTSHATPNSTDKGVNVSMSHPVNGIYEAPSIHNSTSDLGNNYDASSPNLSNIQYELNFSLGDYVWHDSNVNGIQDNGESGISGVTVELQDNNGQVLATTTTDNTGFYQFTNLSQGSYTVKISDSNFQQGGVFFGGTNDVWYATYKDAGNDDAKDSNGDVTTHTANVNLTSDNMTIDFGFFHAAFTLEKTGDQSVNAGDDITYHFTLVNTGDLVLHGGAHVYDPMINPNGNHEIWSGVVQPGAVETFDRTYATTQNDCGQLVNTATAIGHPKMPDGSYKPNITTEDSWTTQVICLGSIGDKVWNDANGNGKQDAGESGVANVTVKLYNCSDVLQATTTTDNNGNYLFNNLTAGSYYVKFELPAGYGFTTANAGTDDTIDSDADATTGKTSCEPLAAGANDLTRDAGLVVLHGSIGDKVWNDANGNGKQDAGESGVANVTVKLYNCSDVLQATTTSDNNGNYLFNNLTAGSYYVKFELPAGYGFTTANAGTDDTIDSDADATTGKTSCEPLAAGANDLTRDAGLVTVQANADLHLEKVVDNTNPADGDIVTYTITVTNDGPDNATGVEVSDLLPTGLDFQSATPSQGSYDETTGVWTVGAIGNGSSATLQIQAQIDLTACSTTSFDLGAAAGYNVFVFGDMSQPSSDTQGKLAVGGDATFSNYSVGDRLTTNGEDVLIVGGDLQFTSGAVYNGNVVYGGTTNLPVPAVSISDGTLRQDTPIDFAAAELYLKNLSAQLSAYAVNGTTDFQWGGLTLTGSNPLLNVFNVSGADLSGANSVQINVPNGSVVLVNIDGQTVSWTGGLSVTGTDISNVLYNFHEATSLTIQGIDLTGTVLAPYADVNFISGVQHGQMIAKSLGATGQSSIGQFNNNMFVGNIPCQSSIINVAEISAANEHDPDSTPGNGNPNEDDYASVTLDFGSGNGNGNGNGNASNWELVSQVGTDLIWTMTYDNSGNTLYGTWGGKIYRETQNGNELLNPDMGVSFIWSIAVDPVNGKIWAATERGVYISRDNGATWELRGLSGKDVRSIIAVGEDHIWAATWGFGVFELSQATGYDFVARNDGLNILAVHALTFNSNGDIFAGTFGEGVMKLENGTTSWVSTPIGYSFVWALNVDSNDKLYAGTYGDGVYTSDDAGTSWEQINDGLANNYIYSIAVNPSDDVFASAWGSGVYQLHTSKGTNWAVLGMDGINVTSLITSSKDGGLYAATDDGKIYKYIDNPLGVNGQDNRVATFNLAQNYPNPFNPSTKIQFSVPKQGSYRLVVYNLLGEEVATLINGALTKGAHEIMFDASRLSSGIYIYSLQGEGNTMTRKMILLK